MRPLTAATAAGDAADEGEDEWGCDPGHGGSGKALGERVQVTAPPWPDQTAHDPHTALTCNMGIAIHSGRLHRRTPLRGSDLFEPIGVHYRRGRWVTARDDGQSKQTVSQR